MLREAKVLELRKKLREEVYPVVEGNSESLEDATMFIQTLSLGIQQKFTEIAKKVMVTELKLEKELNTSNELSNRYVKLLEVLKDFSVADANEVLDTLVRKIQDALRAETKVKTLKDYKLSLD